MNWKSGSKGGGENIMKAIRRHARSQSRRNRRKMLQLSDLKHVENPESIYKLVEIIGEGGFGLVYRALHIREKKPYAVKITKPSTQKDFKNVEKEIAILKDCNHKNIVKYIDAFFHKNTRKIWIILEYCGGGSLKDMNEIRKKKLAEKEISCIIRSILQGVMYLHKKKCVHRDVKCSNILVNAKGEIKLADFGLGAEMSETKRRNSFVGSPFWMAPEVILSSGETEEKKTSYDRLVDVWSIGITSIEIAEGQPPHSDVHPLRCIFLIPNSPPPKLPDNYSVEFRDFVSKCLVKDPKKRKTPEELMKMEFIKKHKKVKGTFFIRYIEEVKQIFAAAGGKREYYKKINSLVSANAKISEENDDYYSDDTSDSSDTSDDDIDDLLNKSIIKNDDSIKIDEEKEKELKKKMEIQKKEEEERKKEMEERIRKQDDYLLKMQNFFGSMSVEDLKDKLRENERGIDKAKYLLQNLMQKKKLILNALVRKGGVEVPLQRARKLN